MDGLRLQKKLNVVQLLVSADASHHTRKASKIHAVNDVRKITRQWKSTFNFS